MKTAKPPAYREAWPWNDRGGITPLRLARTAWPALSFLLYDEQLPDHLLPSRDQLLNGLWAILKGRRALEDGMVAFPLTFKVEGSSIRWGLRMLDDGGRKIAGIGLVLLSHPAVAPHLQQCDQCGRFTSRTARRSVQPAAAHCAAARPTHRRSQPT
jgi:hypothetical protein